MAEPQPSQSEPLLRHPTPEGGRSTRAYKVAGFTFLGCALIVGQAVIAYIVLSQRSDIQALEAQSNNLKTELMKERPAGVVVPDRMAIDSAPMLQMVALDEDDATEVPETFDPNQATDCQLEAAGLKKVAVPYFRPRCDGRGLYQPVQCFRRHCWCVNPENGVEIPGAMRNGRSGCSSAISAGHMGKMPLLTSLSEEAQW